MPFAVTATMERLVGGLWELAFLVGAAVLLAALIWGVISYNRRDPANEPITDEATRELYADPDSYGEKEEKLRRRTT